MKGTIQAHTTKKEVLVYEEKEEDLWLGESPGQDLAHEKGFTDRTSKLVYFIDRELSTPLRLHDTVELLSLDEATIRLGLGQRTGLRPGEVTGIPISLEGFGRVALAGVPLPEWPYEDTLIDLTGYPRLLIHTAFEPSQFPPLGHTVPCETTGRSGATEQSRMRCTYRPLLVRGTLLPGKEIHWDWRDVEALEQTSFRTRLICFRYSMNMLYHSVLPKIRHYGRGRGPLPSQSSLRL